MIAEADGDRRSGAGANGFAPAMLVHRLVAAARLADRPLLRHSSVLFLATLVGQVLGFAVQIVLARTLGIESYGLYAYAVTWISLLALLATLGFDRLLVRHLGEYGATGGHALFRGLLAWTLAASLATSLLVGLAFYGLRQALDPPGSAEGSGVLLWTLATVPLIVAAGLAESALRGCEAHGAATWPSRVLRPLLFAALVAALAWGGLLADARWVLALNAAAILLAMLPSLAALWARLPPRAPRPAPPLPARAWLATSVVLGLNTLALHLNTQIDMLLLGFFGDEAALGTYGAVTRLVGLISVASVAVIAVVQPMIVAARAQGRDLRPLVRAGARLAFAVSAGGGAVVLLFAGDLLAVFGAEFRDGATALRLLACAQIMASPVTLAGPLLAMTGHERDATLVMVAGACATLLLNLLLVPGFGIEGAAAATALSTVAWNLALFAAARRRLGIAALPFGRR